MSGDRIKARKGKKLRLNAPSNGGLIIKSRFWRLAASSRMDFELINLAGTLLLVPSHGEGENNWRK